MDEAYFRRGFAYSYLGDYQRAIQDYNQAIQINPGYARAFAGRGVSLLYQYRDAEAEEDFKRAFDLDPDLRKSFEPLINEAKTKRTRSR